MNKIMRKSENKTKLKGGRGWVSLLIPLLQASLLSLFVKIELVRVQIYFLALSMDLTASLIPTLTHFLYQPQRQDLH
jgi:hypothetical protein